MEKIKLFEDFLLEISSKKLEDVNSHVKKMLDNVGTYDMTWMLHYILSANANSEDSMEQLRKKHRFIDDMLNDDELTFDMDKAIDNYKKLRDNSNGHIKTGRVPNEFIEEGEYEKKTLKTIENILDYYKKNKGVESVSFHEFVKYVYKMFRVLDKTDKNSKASIDNILGVIMKNGINVLNIEKEIEKYREDNKHISILTCKCLKAGDLDGDERDNDSIYPVFYTTFWATDYKDYPFMLIISLFVQKKEYIMGMGCTSDKEYTNIVAFNKKGEQTAFGNEKDLKHFGLMMKGAIKNFGEDKLKKILDDIFEIFAKNGADVKFSYDDLKKNMENYL